MLFYRAKLLFCAKLMIALQTIDAIGFEMVDYLPYSPDIAPLGYCFPRQKKTFKWGKVTNVASTSDLQIKTKNFFGKV